VGKDRIRHPPTISSSRDASLHVGRRGGCSRPAERCRYA
jgi:hypothetical protein